MYSTKEILNRNISIQDFFNKISEYQVYKNYIGDFRIGYIYNSPFRKDDNPSFGIYKSNKTGKLLFKDYGADICGDCIKFVKLMENLKTSRDAMMFILNNIEPSKITEQTHTYTNTNTIIGIVRQPFTEIDIEFWKSFNISLDTLKKFNVYSIKYYLSNNIVKYKYTYGNPMYAYKVFDKFKIYRPYSDKLGKWRSNLNNYDIQGYEQLPNKGELLFITKSLKDVMALYELGYTAIAPPSESSDIPQEVLDDIKKRFKQIIIFYDRDIAGMKYTRKLYHKTKLPFIFTPRDSKCKDISDYIKKELLINGNLNNVKEFIYQKITKL